MTVESSAPPRAPSWIRSQKNTDRDRLKAPTPRSRSPTSPSQHPAMRGRARFETDPHKKGAASTKNGQTETPGSSRKAFQQPTHRTRAEGHRPPARRAQLPARAVASAAAATTTLLSRWSPVTSSSVRKRRRRRRSTYIYGDEHDACRARPGPRGRGRCRQPRPLRRGTPWQSPRLYEPGHAAHRGGARRRTRPRCTGRISSRAPAPEQQRPSGGSVIQWLPEHQPRWWTTAAPADHAAAARGTATAATAPTRRPRRGAAASPAVTARPSPTWSPGTELVIARALRPTAAPRPSARPRCWQARRRAGHRVRAQE